MSTDMFMCALCKKSFSEPNSLLVHVSNHVENNEVPKNFDAKPDDKIEEKLEPRNGGNFSKSKIAEKFKCSFCKKIFSTATKLRIHETIHDEKKPFKCSFCPRKFRKNCNRAVHERIHAQTKNYQGKNVSKSKIVHERIQTRRQTFQAKKVSKLKIVHEKTRGLGKTVQPTKVSKSKMVPGRIPPRQNKTKTPYQCSYCPKAFDRPARKRRHEENVHECFKCLFCPRAFQQSKDKDRHERIHKKEKPFQCSFCVKLFLTKRSLQSHEEKVHGNISLPENEKPDQIVQEKGDFFNKTTDENDKKISDVQVIQTQEYLPNEGQIVHEEKNVAEVSKDEGQISNFHEAKAEHNLDGENLKKKNEKPNEQVHEVKIEKSNVHKKMKKKIPTDFKRFHCTFCPRIFRKRQQRNVHERIHTRKRPFQCKLCPDRFITKKIQKIHERRIHHEIEDSRKQKHVYEGEKFTQEIEKPKMIENLDASKIDTRVQEQNDLILTQNPKSEKRVQMDHESQIVESKENIEKVVENGRTGYKCYFCSKISLTKSRLREHVRIHTGEKPFQCTFCSKRFQRKYQQNRHELKCRSTENEQRNRNEKSIKTFHCSFCPEMFRMKNEKDVHEIICLGKFIMKQNQDIHEIEILDYYKTENLKIVENENVHESEKVVQDEEKAEELEPLGNNSHLEAERPAENVHESGKVVSVDTYEEAEPLTKISQLETVMLAENVHESEEVVREEKKVLQEEEEVEKLEALALAIISKPEAEEIPKNAYESEVVKEAGKEENVLQEEEEAKKLESLAIISKPEAEEIPKNAYESEVVEEAGNPKETYKSGFKCSFCPKKLGNRHKKMVHERIHTGEKPFRCGACLKTFTQKYHCINHVKIWHTKTKWETAVLMTKSHNIVEERGKNVHEERNVEVSEPKEKEAEPIELDTGLHIENDFRGEEKDQTVHEEGNVEVNELKEKDAKLIEPDTGLLIVNDLLTEEHDQNAHKEEKIEEKKPKKEKVKLLKKSKIVHKCSFCPKILRDKAKWLIHERIHTGEKPFECTICGRKFREKSKCTRHVKDVHKKKPKRKRKKLDKEVHGHENTVNMQLDQTVHESKNTRDESNKQIESVKTRSMKSEQNVHECDSNVEPSEHASKQIVHENEETVEVNEKIIHEGETVQNEPNKVSEGIDDGKVDRQIKKDRRHQCNFCPKTFARACHRAVHEKTHKDDRPFLCNICSRQFRKLAHLQKHELIHKNSDVNMIPDLSQNPESVDERNYHKNSEENRRPDFSEETKETVNDRVASPKKKKENTVKNVESSLSKTLEAVKCEKSDEIQNEQFVHESEEASSTNTTEDFRDKVHENDKNSSLSPKQLEKVHGNIQSSEKLYKCSFCSDVYKVEAHLKLHEQITHKVKKVNGKIKIEHRCRYCSQQFPDWDHLKDHLKTHLGLKCRFCPKTLSNKLSLKAHEMNHTGEKPFECRFCKRAYTQKGNRNWHENKCSLKADK